MKIVWGAVGHYDLDILKMQYCGGTETEKWIEHTEVAKSGLVQDGCAKKKKRTTMTTSIKAKSWNQAV